jgi:hypothetical protein
MDFVSWLVALICIIAFWGLIALVVSVIGHASKGHSFPSDESYSYDEENKVKPRPRRLN